RGLHGLCGCIGRHTPADHKEKPPDPFQHVVTTRAASPGSTVTDSLRESRSFSATEFPPAPAALAILFLNLPQRRLAACPRVQILMRADDDFDQGITNNGRG